MHVVYPLIKYSCWLLSINNSSSLFTGTAAAENAYCLLDLRCAKSSGAEQFILHSYMDVQ